MPSQLVRSLGGVVAVGPTALRAWNWLPWYSTTSPLLYAVALDQGPLSQPGRQPGVPFGAACSESVWPRVQCAVSLCGASALGVKLLLAVQLLQPAVAHGSVVSVTTSPFW